MCAHLRWGVSMMMLLSALLAVVFAQAQPDRTMSGEVVDDAGETRRRCPGRPLCPSADLGARRTTAEAQTTTDAEGRFRLKIPPFGRTIVNGVNFLAYRPGLAIAANIDISGVRTAMVLRKPEPRTIKVEGPDGQPIAGVRICPAGPYCLQRHHRRSSPRRWPIPWPSSTGPDGRATLNYLAARDQLVGRAGLDRLDRHPGRPAGRSAGSELHRAGDRDQAQEDQPARPAGSWMRPASPSPIRWSRSGRGAERNWLRPNAVELTGARSARPPTARSRRRITSWSARRIASSSGAGQRTDPLRLDDDRRTAAGLAPHAAAAAADDRRPGRGPPGEAGRERRGLPDGRRTRADRDPDRRPTAASPWADSGRARCSCSPAATASGSTGSWSATPRARSRSS